MWRVSSVADLSGAHENVNALTLVATERWLEESPLSFYGAPVQTYAGIGDKFVASSGIRLFDTLGNGYYSSEPPFAIFPPYIISLALGILPTPELLHILAGLSTLIAAGILFGLFRSEIGTSNALWGIALFLLHPQVIQFYAHLWSWDTAWILPWLIVLWASTTTQTTRLVPIALVTASFLTSYSDNQGVVATTLLTIALVTFQSPRWWLVLLGTLTAVIISAYQYSMVAGPIALLHSLSDRVQSRSLAQLSLADLSQMLNYLASSIGMLIVILLGCALARKSRNQWTNRQLILVVTSGTLCLIHLLIFPQWHSAHEFGFIKWVLFASLFFGFSLEVLPKQTATVAAITTIAVVLAQDWRMISNLRNIDDHRISYRETGEKLHSLGENTELLAVISPQHLWAPLTYFAKRNILHVKSVEEAEEWLISHNLRSGVVVELNKINAILRQETIQTREID